MNTSSSVGFAFGLFPSPDTSFIPLTFSSSMTFINGEFIPPGTPIMFR